MRAALTAIVIALNFSAITLLMWEGAEGVAEGTISGGTIAAFVLTGGLVAGAFGALTEVYGDLVRGAGASGRLAELLAAQSPKSRRPPSRLPLPVPPRGQLEFQNVELSLSHPARSIGA